MLIKICGITEAELARKTALLGADYIGVLFSKVSPRQVNLDTAKEIATAIKDTPTKLVGVFVDESLEQIQAIIAKLGLEYVQLHTPMVKAYANQLSAKVGIIYVVKPEDKELYTKAFPGCLKPERDFLLFENCQPVPTSSFRYFIAGKLSSTNVIARIVEAKPHGVDLSSSLETSPGCKDIAKIREFIQLVRPGYYGRFGGSFVPELLVQPLCELTGAYGEFKQDKVIQAKLKHILHSHVGRPTTITEVTNFAKAINGINRINGINNSPINHSRIFLKREDLLHTGAHKINNAIGQCLLVQMMGKTRIIAETGAGQHGVAVATACAMFNLECEIYMGITDIKRQAPNVSKMQLLGAKVNAVGGDKATLRDAVNAALRDWAASYPTTHYCLGSALGPHPFPQIVAELQSIIGTEAKAQFHELLGRDPDTIIACVGGGSNAIGIFSAFIANPNVRLIGVEAYGRGAGLNNNAARFIEGSPGVLHGAYTYILQDENRQIADTYSISAGLDYPAVGPEHAFLRMSGRATYEAATDKEALAAFKMLVRTEGIIPALESSHALGYLMANVDKFKSDEIILVNLSGRGDKDLPSLVGFKEQS